MATSIKVNKPPYSHPNEQAHREQLARYADDCLHKSGTTPFNILSGIGFNTDLTSSQDNFDPGPYSILCINADSGGYSITGFQEIMPGRFLFVVNSGSFSFTLQHENASSEEHHRIHTQNGSNIIVSSDSVVCLWHDATLDRWRQMY